MMGNYDFESVDYNPFLEKEIVNVAPLTDAQKEIWLSCILGGGEANLSYNQSFSLRFSGNLIEKYVWEACDFLVERHESLRMSFSGDGNTFMVYNHLEPLKTSRDFTTFNEEEKNNAIRGFLENEAKLEFDIINGPLIRFSLFKLSSGSFLFTITAHHLVADGWSFGVMFEEIANIYNSLLDNIPLPLPEATQFSQYAVEMARYTDSSEFQTTEKYWLEKYKEIPEQLELPTDRPRPKERTFNSKRDDFELPTELVGRIKELGIKSRSSLVSTLIAAFEVFLYKITGQEDIVLGLPAAGQATTDHLILVGHCVNLLPIRTKIDPNLSFEDYLKKRRLELMDDYEHQKYTFGNLVKNLNIKRDVSRIPLVPVVFNIDIGMDDQVNFSALEHSLISNPRKYENFEIFLNLTSQDGSLIVEWSYNTDLFDSETITYWMQGFEDLLHQVESNPQKPIKDIVFNVALTLQKLREWNSTARKLPDYGSFLGIFWEQARSNPSGIAFIAEEKEFTYRNLRLYSNAIAKNLRDNGIGKGDVVGVMFDRNEMLLPALLGVLESGACYLPLDPNFPVERLSYMLEDSGAALLLTEKKYRSIIDKKIRDLILDDINLLEDFNYCDFMLPEGVDLAYILYTSGSTGKPKGVKISHLNLLNFLVSMKETLGMVAGEKLLAITTVSFDIAGLELYLPLVAGGTVVLVNNDECRDGRLLLRKMESQKIDIIQATPATYRMLLASGWDKSSKLKLLCGGEALPNDLAAKLLALVGPFWNVYGPTETTIWSSIKKIEDLEQITIGRPIHNTRIYILNENMIQVPIGSVGEICIGGLGVSEGYLNRTELTGEKFVDDPFEIANGKKLYRTGDLGKFLHNGEIVCLGRMDNQVKIRGYRIELGEIEGVLNKHNDVLESAVTVSESYDGDKLLTAYVVIGEKIRPEDKKSKIKDLKLTLRGELPEYMVPMHWVFMETLPLTANNKVDRKKLSKPDLITETLPWDTMPTTASEKLVAEIWSKYLNAKSIKNDGDFFSLGGNSLKAVEVIAAIELETGQNLPVNSIFQFPGLREFASLLDREEKDEITPWKSLVPIQPDGTKIPLYLIHGAGANVTPFYELARHLDPDQPVYGVQSKGLNGIDEPLETIEEMAAFYIQEILKKNPQGPYNLGGQSFGGYVAFEMARQMKQKGLNIQKVILLDVFAYQDEKHQEKRNQILHRLYMESRKKMVDVELLFKSPNTLKRLKSHSFKRKKSAVLKFLGLEQNKTDSDIFHRIEKIRKFNHKAMDEYILKPYSGDLFLIKAKIKTYYYEDMEYHGWKSYAKNVYVYEMEGDHNSMIEDRDLVKKLGGIIQEILG